MKRLFSQALAMFLVMMLLFTCVHAESSSTVRQSSLRLADGMVHQGSFLRDDTGSYDENLLYYAPGGDVSPMVVYGNTLFGRSSMDYIQQYVAKQGLTVTAGVNAAFFDFASGIPYGMVVTDGLLRVSGTGNAIGIRSDGNFFLGDPGLTVKLTTDSGTFSLNYNRPISKGNGFCLYSRDYDYKTKNTLPAYHVILTGSEDRLSVTSQLTLTVQKVVEASGSVDIPEGGFVLSLARESQYGQLITAAEAFRVGDRLTVTCSVAENWADARYTVGAGDMLVQDGKPLTEFTLDSANRKAARTAMGLTERGETVFLTVDTGDASNGMTLGRLAQRMAELGCVSAINLDGGGSTTLGATMPGNDVFTTMNRPSDGKQRDCANFIFFVRPTDKADKAERLFLYPYDTALLPGGSVELSVKATDNHFMPADTPADLTFTATGGTMNGNIFTADAAGTANIIVRSKDAGGQLSILIVETPTSISVRQADKSRFTKAILVEAGATIDLTAAADYLGAELAAADTSFTWSVPKKLGTVTADGVFTAANSPAKGNLEITCGEKTVTVSVDVREKPFTDTGKHWARNYIADLYFRGILNGSADKNGRMTYRPEDAMTRQEFMVALMRFLQVKVEDYADVELPFDDTDKIAGWALNAIKAAYSLGYFGGSQDGNRLLANPKDSITREQAMSILCRTMSVTGDPELLRQFSDYGKVSSWAAEALAAMVQRGIVSGMDGKLQPKGLVTRAQVAKMLYAMDQ
jgi:uncharacterized protein YigE (DUF2233 family)